EVAAPALAVLLAGGFRTSDPALLALTVQLIRWLAPVVWFLSLAGVLMAVLYALQRFTFPAVATAVFNLGIVVAAPLLAPVIGIFSLAVGLLFGSLAQLTLMFVDVRRADVAFTWGFDWRHPALRRILWLYLPIAAGLVVSLFQVGLDRRLASGTGEQSIAWMANATTLQQMPLGLISVAISLAALPRLSQFYAAGDDAAYRQTLGRGLRMLWMLILPAGIFLWLLGAPVTQLLFERGAFTAADTTQVARALNVYLLGMIFAAVDFPLNFAFYARFNTWLPALVGVVSVGVYVVVALTLVQPLGYLGLVWADTAKQAGHAAIMVLLLWRVVGRLRADTLRGFAAIALAGGVMAGVIYLVAPPLSSALPAGALGTLALVSLAGGAGIVVYAAILFAMRFPETQALAKITRIGRG
ncbi:MAG: lipid II flippase MurJ, partial [Caldilinea sp.]